MKRIYEERNLQTGCHELSIFMDRNENLLAVSYNIELSEQNIREKLWKEQLLCIEQEIENVPESVTIEDVYGHYVNILKNLEEKKLLILK